MQMQDEDLGARQHRAAHDPSFPERREQAYGQIVARLDAALAPFGYVLRGATWSRQSDRGRSAVHLQRSRYGWDVQVLLRFVTPDGEAPDHPDWADDADVTLARFGQGDSSGQLAFLDVLETPDLLDRTIALLVSEALPWLEAMHSANPRSITHGAD